jgi:integrase/recombinase XerD
MLKQYKQHLRVEEDLTTTTTIRNYLSGLRHFAVWCEATWKQGYEEEPAFCPEVVATLTITDYRTYLQQILHLKPTSVNHTLVGLKRYFGWVLSTGHLKHDPAKVVKLVAEEAPPLRHLNDQEEQALVAAVTQTGSIRDRAFITFLLHTGLRACELRTLTRTQVSLGKRSGAISALGKRNKYREIPLNATARAALLAYDPSLQKSPQDTTPLFVSEKKRTRLTERGLGYLIKKYAMKAKLQNVGPHDLRHRFGYRMAKSVPLH